MGDEEGGRDRKGEKDQQAQSKRQGLYHNRGY